MTYFGTGGIGTGYGRGSPGGYASTVQQPTYQTSGSYTGAPAYAQSPAQTYAAAEQPHHSVAEDFLAPNRPVTPIVSRMGDVKHIIEQTYSTITGQEFPHDSIRIVICDEDTFRRVHESTGNTHSPGVVGFSYNKYGKGASEIYVKTDHLDSLLLTVGHEIGHVLSPTLPNAHDEEAKAHAFSLAWVETIRDHNIAGLQPNITPNPAHNGLHDVSFDFVTHLLNTGATAYDVFTTLSQGLTSIIAKTEGYYG